MALRRDDAWYHERLAAPPPGRVAVVIDTDAANEIDDQFAIAWAALSRERIDVHALYAAPYSFAHRRAAFGERAWRDTSRFDPPELGMQRSHDEIVRVYAKLGIAPPPVLHGARGYLKSAHEPQRSDAADHLVQAALARRADEPPLVVLALGCATNVASALIAEPLIAERIAVVWTSGYPSHAPHENHSFNLEQDVAAAGVLLDSGVPLVYLPGYHVGAQLRLSLAEVERHVARRGAIGDYLHALYMHNPLWEMHGVTDLLAHSWVIWDLICVAWVLDDGWTPSAIVRTPRLGADKRWQRDDTRHPMREAYAVDRDAIFRDLFRKLPAAAS